MANIFEPTGNQIKAYLGWVATRPAAVAAIAANFKPWKLYRMKSSGLRVQVLSFGESSEPGREGHVSLTVRISGEFNYLLFERDVFGVDPTDLEECELPSPNEPTGAIMGVRDVEENIDELRVRIRPDLWKMVNGKAVERKTKRG